VSGYVGQGFTDGPGQFMAAGYLSGLFEIGFDGH
jgi:hypothetical protein